MPKLLPLAPPAFQSPSRTGAARARLVRVDRLYHEHRLGYRWELFMGTPDVDGRYTPLDPFVAPPSTTATLGHTPAGISVVARPCAAEWLDPGEAPGTIGVDWPQHAAEGHTP